MKYSVKVMFVFSRKESRYQILKYTMFYVESHVFLAVFLTKKKKFKKVYSHVNVISAVFENYLKLRLNKIVIN